MKPARIKNLEDLLANCGGFPDLAGMLHSRSYEALLVAKRYGQTDGGHHKAWVIDQMVRCLTGPYYETFIAKYKSGEDGPETYTWDEGTPP
jgi:hypothetical protein